MAHLAIVGFYVFFCSLHWWLTSADVKDLLQVLQLQFRQAQSSDSLESKRVNQAMDKLRVRNFVLACRFLRQGNFISLIGVPMVYGHDWGACAFMMFAFVSAYVLNSSVACAKVSVSVSSLRRIFTFYYVLMLGGVTVLPQSGALDKAITIYQFIAVVCYVDSAVHVPARIVLTLAEIAHRYATCQGAEAFLEYAPSQVAFAALTCVISVVLEQTLRERLASQLRHSDAESMISGFRRMLRGVCDGEVLLDDRFRIRKGAGSLCRILSTHQDMTMKAFQDLLVQDSTERDQFTKFISQPIHEVAQHLGAPCLRLSMQGPAYRVGVDAYHVALPQLYGSEGAYHLLGLKLDVEADPAIPDATCNSASAAHATQRLRWSDGPLPRGTARSRVSCKSGGTLVQATSNLGELMLLVCAKGTQEVSQIHLKYKHAQSAGRDGEAPPMLKGLIRPTEWETVRSAILKHATGDPNREKRLPRVGFKAFDRAGAFLQARRAVLKPCKDPSRSSRGYVWLHLSDLISEERVQRAPSELADVAELSDVRDADSDSRDADPSTTDPQTT